MINSRWIISIMFLACSIPVMGFAETPKYIPVTTTPRTTIARPPIYQSFSIYNKISPSVLKNMFIALPALGCINVAADAPQAAISTICRSVSRCVSLPSGSSEDAATRYFDMCLATLAEGEARQLWDEFGGPENTLTTSQMRTAIIEGRYAVNAPSFCSCMTNISALTCEQISSTINNPTDYANFENFIPETPECEVSFSSP